MAGKIEGVFIQEKASTIGTGHTAKKVTQTIYCEAKQINDEEVEFHYLAANGEPLNIVEKMPLREFLHDFTFQPDYSDQKSSEDQKRVSEHVANAEEHIKKNEPFSADYEYKNALKIDEEDLRANFGIGNVYLSLGEEEKAKDIFTNISKIDAIFEEENKHFFNECGIQLRKQELYDEAIDYYNKALSLSPDDESLLFNLARALFEKGDLENSRKYVSKLLSKNPHHEETKDLLTYMNRKATLNKPK